MSQETRKGTRASLREEARRAKNRIKSGFWAECREDMDEHLERAREQGLNESKAGRYFAAQVTAKVEGKKG